MAGVAGVDTRMAGVETRVAGVKMRSDADRHLKGVQLSE